jgi:hypothetical protein
VLLLISFTVVALFPLYLLHGSCKPTPTLAVGNYWSLPCSPLLSSAASEQFLMCFSSLLQHTTMSSCLLHISTSLD